MSTLRLRVIRGTNLIAKDLNGKSDPYVLVGWAEGDGFQGGKPALRGETKPSTLTPFWMNATWFEGKGIDISKNHRVLVQVWDEDKVGKDEFMGQIVVDLNQLVMTTGKGQRTVELASRPNKKDKVSGSIDIEYTYYSNEWLDSTKAKLKSEISNVPLDASIVSNLVQALMDQQGSIDSPAKLMETLRSVSLDDKILVSNMVMIPTAGTRPVLPQKNAAQKQQDALFSFFDADSDGVVGARELALGVYLLADWPTTTEHASVWFDRLDVVKDEVLRMVQIHTILKPLIELWINSAEQEYVPLIDQGNFSRARATNEKMEKLSKALKAQSLEHQLASKLLQDDTEKPRLECSKADFVKKVESGEFRLQIEKMQKELGTKFLGVVLDN